MGKNHESWDIANDRIQKFQKEVLKAVLPNARFSQTRMFGAPDLAPNSFDAKISSVDIFKDSPYEYKGDGKFIHFTSLLGLNSILESGWVRMSEFGNLLDRNELLYGAKIFEDDQKFSNQIKMLSEFKENVFCLSACESNDSTLSDPYLWQVYGDKGKGVGIEYSFTNPSPVNYIFGNIQYGIDGLEPLKKLKVLAEKFKEENDKFFPKEFLELIIELESFHKAKKFAAEKEVRLIFKRDLDGKYEHQAIYQDINSNQEIKYFNKLFLEGRHPHVTQKVIEQMGEDLLFSIFPQIEIKRIILGFDISIENKINILDYLNEVKKRYNYNFEIWQMNEETDIWKMR